MTVSRCKWLFALGSLLVPLLVQAQQAHDIVAAQSELRFVSRQMGVPVDGRFTRFGGQVLLDPARPAANRVTLDVALDSVQIGDDATAAELRKPGWFDTARYPSARFVSTQVTPLGAGRYHVTGNFTLKGQTQPLALDVALAAQGGTTFAQGSFTLKRLAYRIGEGEWNDVSLVADDVSVRFKLAIRGLAAP